MIWIPLPAFCDLRFPRPLSLSPFHHPPTTAVSFLAPSDFDCSSSQGQDGSGPGRHPEAPRRDDSLFTPQELARIKKQFEKSLEGNTDEDQ